MVDPAASGTENRRLTLTPDAIDEAANRIAVARREHVLIDPLPAACAPRTVADGYAVQARVLELLEADVVGWFLGSTNVEIQRLLGLDGPYSGALLRELVHSSPASVRAPPSLSAAFEVEFGFRLGADFPPRAEPYTTEEVVSGVESLHPTIEVVISHFDDWTNLPIATIIADNGTDGALVVGDGVSDWRGIDLPSLTPTLDVNGTRVREGHGANVLGDPIAAFEWLVNHGAQRFGGLRAGQVCNTGTCTSIYFAEPGDRAVADFGPIGRVSLTLTG